VIAAESASFIQAFTRIGLIPDAGGTWWLPRQVGMARAMGAALFAERIGARQAADWGMIWEAVPDADFAAHIAARAAQLAQGPTEAYRLLKAALRASPANDLPEQLALEAELQGQAGRTADFREGVAAFLEKLEFAREDLSCRAILRQIIANFANAALAINARQDRAGQTRQRYGYAQPIKAYAQYTIARQASGQLRAIQFAQAGNSRRIIPGRADRGRIGAHTIGDMHAHIAGDRLGQGGALHHIHRFNPRSELGVRQIG